MAHRFASTAVGFILAAGLVACGGSGGETASDDTIEISAVIERSLIQIDKSQAGVAPEQTSSTAATDSSTGG